MFLRNVHLSRVSAFRCFCSTSEAKLSYSRTEHFVVTTPIFYVNSVPHIGHAYTVTLADVIARWQRLKYPKVTYFLSSGADEHGVKIQTAAKEMNLSPRDFAESNGLQFRKLFDDLNINYSAFIRTTDEKHKNMVHDFWNVLVENGFIYKGSYEGWYCTSDEEFLSEKDTTLVKSESGGSDIRVSASSGHLVEKISEENYMFKLSALKQRVLEVLVDSDFVQPVKFRNSVVSWIESGLMDRDLSVSRPTSRCDWGIKVPGDDSQVIYVWLDALVNYLTVTQNKVVEDFWPADLQIVGKDILKFHAVFWPAFLLAAEKPLPKKILCHSHWTCEGHKMSKSRGNVVNPFDYIGDHSSDLIRLYLISAGSLSKDNNFSHSSFVETVNNFANCFGNALNRVLTIKTTSLLENSYPWPDFNLVEKFIVDYRYLFDDLTQTVEDVQQYYETYNTHLVPERILLLVAKLNKFINDSKFWKMEDENEKIALFYISFEVLRCAAILFWPITPLTSTELLERLSIVPAEMSLKHCSIFMENEMPPWAGRPLRPDQIPLVKPIRDEEEGSLSSLGNDGVKKPLAGRN